MDEYTVSFILPFGVILSDMFLNIAEIPKL